MKHSYHGLDRSRPSRSASRWTRAWINGFCALLALAMTLPTPRAQTIGGTTGLFTVPTADMPEDREISLGSSLLNREYQEYRLGDHHLQATYIRLGFTPFLEVGLRLTRALRFDRPQAIGDRMVSARLRLLPEGRVLPAVVVGVHDPITSTEGQTNQFHALYVVASKNVREAPLVDGIGLHLGYGSDLLPARYYQFLGPFGGVSVRPIHEVEVMVEYDGRGVNGGVRLTPFCWVTLVVGAERFEALSGTISFRARLPS